mmetsp:Transcript_32013/g.61600  ORF Transcript_32013/g.61600 Transcript_32013/m.61600 type:complete len:380 (+) Transcript_32013:302-1441(+)
MYTGVFHYLANIPLDVHPLYVSVQKRFWMQADVLLYMLMGVSVATFFDMCKCISSPLRISLFVDVAQSTWQTVISAAVVALLAVRVSDGWVQAQQSDNWYLWHYGKSHLEPLPQGAMLVVWGDLQQFSIRYLQLCEGERPDVSIVDLSMASYPWYVPSQRQNVPNVRYPEDIYHPQAPHSFSLGDLFDANINNMPIYTLNPPANDISWQRRYLLMPVGVNHRVVLRSSPLPLSEWLLESSQALPLFPLPPPALYGPATWEARLAVEMKGAMHSFAKEALRLAKLQSNQEALLRALDALEGLMLDGPEAIDAEVLFDHGYVHQELFKTTQLRNHLHHMLFSFQRFVTIVNHTDARRAQVLVVLKHYHKELAALGIHNRDY